MTMKTTGKCVPARTYETVSKSFHFGYSVWDYGGTSINLELARK